MSRSLGDLPAFVASLPSLSPDEAAEFIGDLDEAREALGRGEVRDPWQS